MFRLLYENSPLDFVPPQLRNATSTDIAEAIFGYSLVFQNLNLKNLKVKVVM